MNRLMSWMVLGLALFALGCQQASDVAVFPSPAGETAPVYNPPESPGNAEAAADTIPAEQGSGLDAPENSPASELGSDEPQSKDGESKDGESKDGESKDGESKDGESKDGEGKADDNPLEADPYERLQRFAMPDPPRDAEWLNSRPLKMKDLKGKFVIFDFWTYCCINCIHILPELKKLEKKYADQVVVIGVHSAKFTTEKDKKNIAEAILRYEIEHPVLVDSEHEFWDALGVRSWPTVLLVDPEGYAARGKAGEITFEELEQWVLTGLAHYREKKLLDETPLRFDLLSYQEKSTPLRFPGKVLADEAGGRLFVTDSNHNRIVVSDMSGKVLDIIGSGKIGREDGAYTEASFDHPQGVALHGETLYVSDTENHMIRKVDLAKKQVSTIAGLGRQNRGPWPGLENLRIGDPLPERYVGKPLATALNSPWALWVHEDALYIAMAGPHQIWKMALDGSEIGPFAGNGREDIVDGALLPKQPYDAFDAQGEPVSSFAQPSGLASDGEWLFVADSEGSSIRAVPFDPAKRVRTVVGTAELPGGRLFEFGDVDGPKETAKLQHCLGVVFHEGKIYAADTYNNKVKEVDAETGAVKTLAGDGEPGKTNDPARFDEPAGIAYANGRLFVADTNNHLIRTIDLESGAVGVLEFQGLEPPKSTTPAKPNLERAEAVKVEPATVQAKDGKITLQVALQLPFGWKINDLAPMQVWVEAAGDVLAAEANGFRDIAEPKTTFTFELPVAADGKTELSVYLPFFYCQEDGTGLCKTGEVVWSVPLTVAADAKNEQLELSHTVE